MTCPHLNFNCNASVNRISKSDEDPEVIVAYTAEIRIDCRDCGQPLEFFGLPHGLSFYRPTVSLNRQELRAPLVLPGTEPPAGLAGFAVTHTVFNEKEAVKQ
jgi:hypothetical protein